MINNKKRHKTKHKKTKNLENYSYFGSDFFKVCVFLSS